MNKKTNRSLMEELDRNVAALDRGGLTRAEVEKTMGKLRRFRLPARPLPPPPGGSLSITDSDAVNVAYGPPSEAETAVAEEFEGALSDEMCSPYDPPEAPRVPSFTRLLSAEGFARWVRRMESGDDPTLRAHCVETRRRYLPYGAALSRALDSVLWPFPSFAPRARPYDWAVDA